MKTPLSQGGLMPSVSAGPCRRFYMISLIAGWLSVTNVMLYGNAPGGFGHPS